MSRQHVIMRSMRSLRAIRAQHRVSSSTRQVQSPSTVLGAKFQLLPSTEKAGDAEDLIFEGQASQLRQWWASSRYEGIKRPYTAEDIVSKRGTLQQVYPSSLLARKLYNLLEERAAAKQPVHTSEYLALS